MLIFQGVADAKVGEAKGSLGLKLEDVWRVPVDSSGFVARKGKIQEELKRIAEERKHGGTSRAKTPSNKPTWCESIANDPKPPSISLRRNSMGSC